MDTILKKNPNEMTENEKVVWKVEVFRQCEDTEDYINEKIQELEVQKKEFRQVITDSRRIITTYNDAVD